MPKNTIRKFKRSGKPVNNKNATPRSREKKKVPYAPVWNYNR